MNTNTPKKEKVLLAYSGGLDSMTIAHWLSKDYEVVTYTGNLGSGEDYEPLVERTIINLGIPKENIVIADLTEKLLLHYLEPALRANAAYQNQYLLSTSIARQCLVEEMVRYAQSKDIKYIAHGSTIYGNDIIRFHEIVKHLDASINVLAPWAEWVESGKFKGREDLIEYASKNNIPIAPKYYEENGYSTDENIIGKSLEGLELEFPYHETSPSMWTKQMINTPMTAPDEECRLTLVFNKGNVIHTSLDQLNYIGNKYGIGQVTIVEDRYNGNKSRGAYSTPGVTIIQAAHKALESLTLSQGEIQLQQELQPKYSTLVYEGAKWFGRERQALQALFDKIQQNVTGAVTIQLYKGNIDVLSIESPNSLWIEENATFEDNQSFSKSDIMGFIEVNSIKNKG